ncbi:MAG: pyrroline-5-carboxylate reductase [Chromatiaceae bacterium]|jgi:pyrroline-5-carboxylate reductase|nr:pyrroline-5-carboxylate reductase [Chromatiaceae bacterium]
MTRETIAFIGGGNMAGSLIAGLVSDGYDPANLIVSEPDADKREQLTRHYGVRVTQDNATAQGAADVVLLCVKPQMAHAVCSDLGLAVTTKVPLYISVMAGIREASIQAWLGGPRPLVRTMPNTPAMIQAGAIVLHASPEVSPGQRNRAETIMRAGGLTRWVDEEDLLDAVTAVSGSGPAYFFLLMEELEKVAVELGLDAESARLLTIQTALGAARMAMESSLDPRELRERVTSPGGTTECALKVLMEGDFSNLVARAVRAAQARSQELSTLLATHP